MTRPRGLFITIDGPSGIGKSTTTRALARELTRRGAPVHQTAEPSTCTIGTFTRNNADTIHGHALACLVAADRYTHIDHEIQPHLRAGDTVLCDRYIASTLVLQQLDGVPLPFLLALNADILKPDLAVILTAPPALIAQRIADRGIRHRFHLDPATPARETDLYDEAAQTLKSKGVKVLLADTSRSSPPRIAARIADALPGTPLPSSPGPHPPPRQEP
ncbi:dTMP kinase [Streptomyces sp. NPDC093252]|uniref:dTMP kinase n=1 Tax=Streptomyces sp. NPDC093252 TaxID=3154980 RepID=UPI003437BEC2